MPIKTTPTRINAIPAILKVVIFSPRNFTDTGIIQIYPIDNNGNRTERSPPLKAITNNRLPITYNANPTISL